MQQDKGQSGENSTASRRGAEADAQNAEQAAAQQQEVGDVQEPEIIRNPEGFVAIHKKEMIGVPRQKVPAK